MVNKTLECCVSGCREEPISLITVTDKGKEVAKYAPCKKHEAGTANAVQVKYAGYQISIADIHK